MADCLNLVAKEFSPRCVEHIQFGRCAHTEIPVVDIIESVDGVGHLLLSCIIPRTIDLVGVHTVGEVERRIDVQIVEQGEVATDWDVVLHTIAPITREA